MHLTLQQLKLFDSVARNAGYTPAARELHLTQPAVSIQIKRLEEQLGLALFERVGKQILLTQAGKVVHESTLAILEKLSEMANVVEQIKGDVKGPLQLAVVTTTKYFLPHLIGEFLQCYPDVEPRLRFTNRERVVERLDANLDDFVIMGQLPPNRNLVSHPFLENILVPVARPDHPLAKRKGVSLQELAAQRFLHREQGSGTRMRFEQLLQDNGLEATPYMELGSMEAVKQGVMAGLGVAVLSLHALRLELETGRLSVLDVEGFPLKRQWYLVHQKGKALSLTAQTFLEFILSGSAQYASRAQE